MTTSDPGHDPAHDSATETLSTTDRVRILAIEVLSDDWYTLRKATFDLRRRDGTWQRQSREAYDRGNGATILLYDPERRTVVLTRQFRYPAFANGHAGMLIEAAAGLLDDASPEDRIRTEAEEETGYRVRAVRKVFEAFMSPSSVTEKLHVFVGAYSPADLVRPGGGIASESEDIEVIEVIELPIDRALAMVETGEIADARAIILLEDAALLLFRD